MKKRIKALLLSSLIGTFLLSACNSGQNDMINGSLFVTIENSKVERFDSVKLMLKNGVDDVEWASSDENVAKIDDGELIALKEGNVVISAISGNTKQEQTISIIDSGKLPTIDVDYLPIIRGDSYALDVNAYFNNKEMKGVTFEYSVADTSIANVENSILKGISYGDTTINISLSWYNQADIIKKEIPCTVTKNTAVYTDKAEYTLYTMDSVLGTAWATQTQIQTSVYYENTKLEDLTFSWSSTDENIVTVDQNGNIYAVAMGSAYVVGKCDYNGEELSTRLVPVHVEKPFLKTDMDLAFDINQDAVFDSEKVLGVGYSIGKIVDIETKKEYAVVNNRLKLDDFVTGEYEFDIYEQNMQFSIRANVVFADYIVRTVEDLKTATAAKSGYIALVEDLENVGAFKTENSTSDNMFSGVFNGLGHTISGIIYQDSNRSLFSFVGDCVFKNLAVISTCKTINSGALFYQSRGNVVIQDCYLDVTLEGTNLRGSGGVGGLLFSGSFTAENSIIKVEGLSQNEEVRKYCGAIAGRTCCMLVECKNTYLIANGNSFSEMEEATNNCAKYHIKKRDNIFNDELEFISAKEEGFLELDGYNRYWDLTGDIPSFL